jgi:hypothetical protein
VSQVIHSNRFPQLRGENISFGPGAGAGVGIALMLVGVAAAGVTFFLGRSGTGDITAKHALAAYHIGTLAVLAMALGGLFFTLVFHLFQAGWVATIRRQFENVASFVPIAFLMVVPTLIIEIASGGMLFKWLIDAQTGDYLLAKKGFYFFFTAPVGKGEIPFPTFFVLRAVLYGLAWFYLARKMVAYGRAQDEVGPRGDVTPFAHARFTAAWGILVFALTTAFASFDWLMSLDYKFFSTMWGVYYFAGAAFSGSALMAVILSVLRMRGKLEGTVTQEHFHDLGKLMFSFTVFWAYISFSQYFLIWYSNIPEETAFYKFRGDHWGNLGIALMIGHFVAPFLILIFRGVKRNYQLLVLVALFMLFIHIMDIYWIVRPMVYIEQPAGPAGPFQYIVDAIGILAPVLVLAGYLVKRVGGNTLVGTGDPYLSEAMGHKNYV